MWNGGGYSMKINITDFMALKNVDFEIQEGINVVAGKNGSGKSQLLLAIAHNGSKHENGYYYLLEQMKYVIDKSYKNTNGKLKNISMNPEPMITNYRQSIRNLASDNKNQEYGMQKPMSSFDFMSSINYSNTLKRYEDLFSLITTLKLAGTVKEADEDNQRNWEIITDGFNTVFNKKLDYKSDINGTKIGVTTSKGISNFYQLSTGELEFLSLLADLVLFKNDKETPHLILIDELDSHFHPDLQKKIIEVVSDLCKQKYVVITTHSPAVMMSVSSDRLFYLEKDIDCKNEDGTYRNQINKISDDIQVFNKIAELYSGFSADLRYNKFIEDSFRFELVKYAGECLKDPDVFDALKGKETDPQIAAIQNVILGLEVEEPKIVEIGCGLGRTLALFNSIDIDTLAKTSYYGVDICEENLSEIDIYATEIGLKDKLKSFEAKLSFDNSDADICIFANVIHELPRQDICQILNDYIKYLKPNGKIFVLECLELPVGEKNYVVFNLDALKALFSSEIENGNVTIKSASPSTRSGIPLMNAVITVKNPQISNITNDNLVLALNKVVEHEKSRIEKHYSAEAPLRSIAFASVIHNLANAQIDLINLST